MLILKLATYTLYTYMYDEFSKALSVRSVLLHACLSLFHVAEEAVGVIP